jgi:hypothetical protein
MHIVVAFYTLEFCGEKASKTGELKMTNTFLK